MKLSILDQSPVSPGQTGSETMEESVKLAQLGEELGYTRYWMTEHHDLPGIAGSVPEVMLSYIGAFTRTIRLGTGAVLLPHYKPYKVAEIHNMLATLFPGRIDLGMGRAPGGSAEATNVLSDNFLQNVGKMLELVRDVLHFLDDDYPSPNKYSSLSASPIPDLPPIPWLLGTSEKSALLAAEYGIAYAYAQFMSENDGPEIIQQYRDKFHSRKTDQPPQVIIAVSAICAETSEKANKMADSTCLWSVQKEKGKTGQEGVPSIQETEQYILTEEEVKKIENMKQSMVIGNPQEVKEQLQEMTKKYQADEIMIITTTHFPEDRQRSYKLIAD